MRVLDIKLTKTPLIYSVSRFNLGGLGALFEKTNPTKAPRSDGTELFYYGVLFKK